MTGPNTMTARELQAWLRAGFPKENERYEWKEWRSLKSNISGRKGEDLVWYISALANLAGAPAASLPVHLTAEGLPIGIQIMAPIGRDDVVIEASARYEREIGFTS